MENLKFRALYKPTNKYADIDSIDFANKIVVLKSYPLVRSFGLDKVDFDDVVIEQFAGLTDKNKKKIYEGDIVLLNKQVYCRVVYEQNTCAFMLIMLPDRFYNPPLSITNEKTQYIEVIGNIHENAELLKGE